MGETQLSVLHIPFRKHTRSGTHPGQQGYSPALARARLWPTATPPEDLDAQAIFKALDLKLNQTKGLSATLTRAATSIPGAMEKGLAYDYKKNLY